MIKVERIAMLLVGGALFGAGVLYRSAPAAVAEDAQQAKYQAQLISLEAQLNQMKKLADLVPDQAAVMSHVAYHFSNLWFAGQQENWELAGFYLGETRNNIKWAVRVKPMRKDSAGRDIDVGGIAQAVDNTQLAALKQAIDAKQKDRFVKAYEETLSACFACHKAASKPYLRPQKPSVPEAPIINFDPGAKWPE